jgi:hypothetical protein
MRRRGEEVFLLRLDHGGIKILNVSILNPTMLAIGRSKFCSDPREMRRMSEMGRGRGGRKYLGEG